MTDYKVEWLHRMVEIIGYNKAMCDHLLFLIKEFRHRPELIDDIERNLKEQVEKTTHKLNEMWEK